MFPKDKEEMHKEIKRLPKDKEELDKEIKKIPRTTRKYTRY